MSENTAKTTEQLLADEKIRVEEWQEYGLKECNRRVKAERELATERSAREQLKAEVERLREEVQAYRGHVENREIILTAAEQERDRLREELQSARNFSHGLLENLEDIRVATEYLDEGTGANTATALAIKAADLVKDLRAQVKVAKEALENIPLDVSSIGPCSGTPDWNYGYNAAARHAAYVAKQQCDKALSQLNSGGVQELGMSVKEAKEKHVCRICNQPVRAPFVLNYGEEFAHRDCLKIPLNSGAEKGTK